MPNVFDASIKPNEINTVSTFIANPYKLHDNLPVYTESHEKDKALY